ncbi:MAG: SurA N-terminal domain-containing protein [Candidatus Omnitrophica bacterium]|nr:SurA N-terminal domain-containing protein [Candidatus Omnitrophota bacterium]
MLKIMRKKGFAKKVLWFVTVIIILSFGIFGAASYYSRQTGRDVAGRIFGKKVPAAEFLRTLQNVQVQAMIQYGDKFNQVKQFMNFENETWDRLILSYEAARQKIKIANEDVVKAIQSYPFFQRDDKFDNKLYNDILKFAFRMTPVEFEDNVRELLKISKIFDANTKGVNLSDREIYDAFKNQNEKIQVSYFLISPEDYKSEVKFDEAKARQYYEENKNTFVLPPSISIDYISLAFPPDSTEEQKNALREKADSIMKSLETSLDINTTGKALGIDVKNSGLFSLERPNLSLGLPFDFINSLFKLKEKEYAVPEETEMGIIIAQIKEKKDSHVAVYEEVKDAAKDIVLTIDAEAIAIKKAEEAFVNLKNEMAKTTLNDFTGSAKALGLKAGQTPLFTRGQYIPEIGISREFQDAAFALNNDKKLSDLVKIANGYCVLFLDKYEAADDSQYQKDKIQISAKLLEEKKNSTFMDFMAKLRLEANLEDYTPKDEKEGH